MNAYPDRDQQHQDARSTDDPTVEDTSSSDGGVLSVTQDDLARWMAARLVAPGVSDDYRQAIGDVVHHLMAHTAASTSDPDEAPAAHGNGRTPPLQTITADVTLCRAATVYETATVVDVTISVPSGIGDAQVNALLAAAALEQYHEGAVTGEWEEVESDTVSVYLSVVRRSNG